MAGFAVPLSVGTSVLCVWQWQAQQTVCQPQLSPSIIPFLCHTELFISIPPNSHTAAPFTIYHLSAPKTINGEEENKHFYRGTMSLYLEQPGREIPSDKLLLELHEHLVMNSAEHCLPKNISWRRVCFYFTQSLISAPICFLTLMIMKGIRTWPLQLFEIHL